ncbi:MAG: hypothetical protein WDW36_010253 [Sanguina aurantia]
MGREKSKKALHLRAPIARVISAYVDGNNTNFELMPVVLQTYVTERFGSGPVVANLFTLAQQLQSNPSFFATVGDATEAMVQIFLSLKSNPLASSGRKLQSLPDDAVKLLLAQLLQSSGANPVLGSVFDPNILPNLLFNAYNFVKVMVDDYQSVKYRQKYLWHSELLGHAVVYTPFLDVNGLPLADGNGANISATPLHTSKGQIISLISGRRALLQTNTATSSSMALTNIPTYAPGYQQPSTLPPLRIPIIFHVTLYQCTTTGFPAAATRRDTPNGSEPCHRLLALLPLLLHSVGRRCSLHRVRGSRRGRRAGAPAPARSNRAQSNLSAAVVTSPPAAAAALLTGRLPSPVTPVTRDTTSATGYGPPNWNNAAASCANLVSNMNIMATPARISFWVQECRADPVAYPYLVIAGGQAGYDACVAAPSDGYFSDQCGGMIPNSIANYPRAINVYVNGRAGQAQFAGYSSQPLLTNSPINGHVSIAMCEFDSVGGTNNEINYQDGSQILMHEVGHALGLAHTFYEGTDITAARDNCIDADGVTDTMTTNGAVSSIPFNGIRALGWCNKAVTRLGSFSVLYQRQAAGLNPRPDELNLQLQSCANSSTRTPYAPNNGGDELGNYMSYSYSSCLAAFGHFTQGQVQAIHASMTNVAAGTNNNIMYQWGQYYASLPLSQLPTGYASYNVANPPSPPLQPPNAPSPHQLPPRHPPPPPTLAQEPPPAVSISLPAPAYGSPPPSLAMSGRRLLTATDSTQATATTGCAATQHNCSCSSNWYYQDPSSNAAGAWYSGCANLGDSGAWCAIDKVAGCSSGVRNGWWDYCQATTCATVVTTAPVYSPPTGVALPPLPADNCTAGGVTISNARCSALNWQSENYDASTDTVHSGCANPDSDPNGAWCSLVPGTTTNTGRAWDYCQPQCTTDRAALASCTTAVTNVPAGCTCANDWAFQASDGTTMLNAHGCTAMTLGGNQIATCQLVCPAGSANAASDGSYNYGCQCN